MKGNLLIGFLFAPILLVAQDSASRKSVWAFNGYLKELQWIRLNKDFSKPVATNLVHNRLNLKWNAGEQWAGRLEIRNRLYWGGDVHEQPGFKEQLRNQSEAVNLSVNWFDAGLLSCIPTWSDSGLNLKKLNGMSGLAGNASIGVLPIPGRPMIFLIVTTSLILITKNVRVAMPLKHNTSLMICPILNSRWRVPEAGLL